MQLPLTIDERKKLRTLRIKLNKIGQFTETKLQRLTHFEKERCKLLIALSQLQNLASVGPSMASKLYNLGFTNIEKLKNANPVAMVKAYEQQIGRPVDPCVEDVFRCAIAQSKYINLTTEAKNWWYWTKERGNTAVKYN